MTQDRDSRKSAWVAFWQCAAISVCAVAACVAFKEPFPTTAQIIARSKTDAAVAMSIRGVPPKVVSCVLDRPKVLLGENPCDRILAEYQPEPPAMTAVIPPRVERKK